MLNRGKMRVDPYLSFFFFFFEITEKYTLEFYDREIFIGNARCVGVCSFIGLLKTENNRPNANCFSVAF